jgi:hypothetical protein
VKKKQLVYIDQALQNIILNDVNTMQINVVLETAEREGKKRMK